MKERVIMIGQAVHEKLMEMKTKLEDKIEEKVSFNAFLMMMLEQFERLDEAVRMPEDMKIEKKDEEDNSVIPHPWPTIRPAIYKYQKYRWTYDPQPPRYYTWTSNSTSAPSSNGVKITIPDGGANTSGGLTWYAYSSSGAQCKSCGQTSVVNGACTNCGVSQ